MNNIGIDASGPLAGVAVLDADGVVLTRFETPGRPGLIETLPGLLARAVALGPVGLLAVSIGPGSFTGLRTALSLTQGYAGAAGVTLAGVPADEAFAEAFARMARPLWVAIRARKGRIYLIRDGVAAGFADVNMPRASRPVALAGDAAPEMAARLAAAGSDVLLTDARRIDPVWVIKAALRRQAAGLAPHAALPVYVDPPEAKLPEGGLRPPPVFVSLP
ncbi:MAG: tRNA (adenosine(37)-N6)-threonylcarbamoyltransferase complex dimerization subunit type 1 TsaB [Acidocella sp.]|nr:tRNA (adenosine(37)-N6)-threonylcarbamoyltransferase complex dimerization subunit type 1 TsaB [Acidocella sp.]